MIKRTDWFNSYKLNDTTVNMYGENEKDLEIRLEEVEEYIRIFEEKTGKKIKTLTLKPDGEYMECEYEVYTVPFERIRRITGYLVGTLDNWNDAKREEEKDRVKHSTKVEELI